LALVAIYNSEHFVGAARGIATHVVVVHLHDEDWVFLPASGNQFRRVAVRPGPQEKDGSSRFPARRRDKAA